MQNEYIMTSTELDEKFVDDASDNHMTDEERNYWIDLEEGETDEEIEETSYQMSDEEQEGLEQYLDDARDDIPECTDAKVNLFWDTYAGFTSSEQRKLERADELRRAKENQRMLDRNPLLKRVVDEKTIGNLNNHFNPNA